MTRERMTNVEERHIRVIRGGGNCRLVGFSRKWLIGCELAGAHHRFFEDAVVVLRNSNKTLGLGSSR